MMVLRKCDWTVPSEQPTPVVVVAVNTLEPVSDWPSAMAIVWKALSFRPGNWAMISPLLTVTTPLASVVAALAAPAVMAIGAITAAAARPARINFFMVWGL